MTLYKYRIDSEFTEQIFTEKKIWLSNASGLNDPFECTIQKIAKEWIEKEVKKLKSASMLGFISGTLKSIKNNNNFYDLSPRQTKEFLTKYRQKGFDEQYKTVREFIYRETMVEISNPEKTFQQFDEQLNSVGIFSLSEDPENLLMWTHYAGSSKGIAIGFEVPNEAHCLKVNYTDELPVFNSDGFLLETKIYLAGCNVQKIAFNDPTFKLAISTKSTKWQYEKEWRYVEEISGKYNFPGKIKEVVFGLRCPLEVREKYLKLVKNNFDYGINFSEIIVIENTNQIKKSIVSYT